MSTLHLTDSQRYTILAALQDYKLKNDRLLDLHQRMEIDVLRKRLTPNVVLHLDTPDAQDDYAKAVAQFLDFGDRSNPDRHSGYFGKGGWAYETLKKGPPQAPEPVNAELLKAASHLARIADYSDGLPGVLGVWSRQSSDMTSEYTVTLNDCRAAREAVRKAEAAQSTHPDTARVDKLEKYLLWFWRAADGRRPEFLTSWLPGQRKTLRELIDTELKDDPKDVQLPT